MLISFSADIPLLIQFSWHPTLESKDPIKNNKSCIGLTQLFIFLQMNRKIQKFKEDQRSITYWGGVSVMKELNMQVCCLRTCTANTHAVVRLQRRTNNTQRWSNVDTTTSKLQRCSNIVSKWGGKFNSQHAINLVLKMSSQRRYWGSTFTTLRQRRLNAG